jgi:hypothetical protein
MVIELDADLKWKCDIEQESLTALYSIGVLNLVLESSKVLFWYTRSIVLFNKFINCVTDLRLARLWIYRCSSSGLVPCELAGRFDRFGGTNCLHLQGGLQFTSVSTRQTRRRCSLADRHTYMRIVIAYCTCVAGCRSQRLLCICVTCRAIITA